MQNENEVKYGDVVELNGCKWLVERITISAVDGTVTLTLIGELYENL